MRVANRSKTGAETSKVLMATVTAPHRPLMKSEGSTLHRQNPKAEKKEGSKASSCSNKTLANKHNNARIAKRKSAIHARSSSSPCCAAAAGATCRTTAGQNLTNFRFMSVRSASLSGGGTRISRKLNSMGCVNGKCASKASTTTTSSSSVGGEIDSLPQAPMMMMPPPKAEACVQAVRIPSHDYILKYSFLSHKGYYPDALDKANQDSFCVETCLNGSPNDHFFAVFDGHGQFGSQCSDFARRMLVHNLAREPRFKTDASAALDSAFAATNEQLHDDAAIDDSMSGTTAIAVLVRGRTLYAANVGDSRAVLAQRRLSGDLVALDLSCDQTPFRADEYDRVRHCGARVLSLDQLEGLKDPTVQCWGTEDDALDGGDPPRLWLPSGNYPGTAFTRSIGDGTAESIGVIAVPEIKVVELSPDNPFFVIASDGVFEFLSSQAVVDMVAKFKDPHDACVAIASESHRLWLQNETRTDDITIIVVQIHGLKNVESPEFASYVNGSISNHPLLRGN